MLVSCRFVVAKNRFNIDELHHKVAHFLVNHFDIILMPVFETARMTKHGGLRLTKKSVRQMLTLSHYRFRKLLLHKAKTYEKVVIDATEEYTSKTVSWTDEVVNHLGGAKVIYDKAGQKMCRDLNGHGIFIKNSYALLVQPPV